MNTMNKILILYYSGSGSTRLIGEILGKHLLNQYKVDITEITKNFNYNTIEDYSLIILGFPSYHCEAPNPVIEFVSNMPALNKRKKTYVYTTCGIYGGNGIRNLVKLLITKNLVTINYMVITGPASDGSLMFPTMMSKLLSRLTYVLRFHVTTGWKIKKNAASIDKIMKSLDFQLNIPLYKWYVPLNNIAKYFGENKYNEYKENIHIIKDRCSNCKICIKNCTSDCWSEGIYNPEFSSEHCEFCLKCIHHCPEKAIIFSDAMKDKMRLNRKFYKDLARKYFSSD